VTVLEAFIVPYKETFYAEPARARLDELNKQRLTLSIPSKKQSLRNLPPQT
jgi:hypothetical protein